MYKDYTKQIRVTKTAYAIIKKLSKKWSKSFANTASEIIEKFDPKKENFE